MKILLTYIKTSQACYIGLFVIITFYNLKCRKLAQFLQNVTILSDVGIIKVNKIKPFQRTNVNSHFIKCMVDLPRLILSCLGILLLIKIPTKITLIPQNICTKSRSYTYKCFTVKILEPCKFASSLCRSYIIYGN